MEERLPILEKLDKNGAELSNTLEGEAGESSDL